MPSESGENPENALTDADLLTRKWRIVAKDGDRRVEREYDGVLTDLAIDGWFHLEQMDDYGYRLRIGDAEIVVSIEDDDSIFVDVQRGAHGPTNGPTDVPPGPGAGARERVSVRGADDQFYVRTMPRPATGELDQPKAAKSYVTGIGHDLDNYRGPDVVADFSEDGDLLGLELLFRSDEADG